MSAHIPVEARTSRSAKSSRPFNGPIVYGESSIRIRRTSGVSSSPPPRKLTASLSTINSPIFLITSLRLRGCVPVDSSRPGTLPTLSRCAFSLASTSARAEERARATENVYRVKNAAYVGDCWKECSSGGRPRRMRFPLILVSLYARRVPLSVRAVKFGSDMTHSLGSVTKSTSSV